ncbi:MAG: phosphoribosylformylglycinamidine synthase subunit PurS [Alicyclobacillus sp.]|nr:phosphoribosylformylglycinamidine synthase subunit PurS [Alicyclobacillus sp.]
MVHVLLKPSVFDPQGRAVEEALHTLGYTAATQLRVGKCMQLQVHAAGAEEAAELVRQMCDQVLCNPVMETYTFTLQAQTDGAEDAP